jgi:hypothetical protein
VAQPDRSSGVCRDDRVASGRHRRGSGSPAGPVRARGFPKPRFSRWFGDHRRQVVSASDISGRCGCLERSQGASRIPDREAELPEPAVGGHRSLPARGHHVATAVMTEGERSLGVLPALQVAPVVAVSPRFVDSIPDASPRHRLLEASHPSSEARAPIAACADMFGDRTLVVAGDVAAVLVGVKRRRLEDASADAWTQWLGDWG